MSDFVRFSRSSAWDRSAAFYRDRGAAAWAGGAVPMQISTNPALADAYAAMIVDFIEATHVHPALPVYVVEIGAGPGALAARLLDALHRHRLPDGPPIVYVVTDLAEANLDFVCAHPVLAPHVAAGRLDVAVLDLEEPAPLVLRHRGETLAPSHGGNPVVLVANYVLDSLRSDLFHASGGQLREVLVRATRDEAHAELELEVREQAFEGAYYEHPMLDRMLDAYRAGLTDGWFAFAPAGLLGLRWLLSLGGDNGLLIVGDKARRTLADWDGRGVPLVTTHEGAISLSANLHAVQLLFEGIGGVAMHASSAVTHFTVSAFAACEAGAVPRVRRSHRRFLDEVGPSSVYYLWREVRRWIDEASLEAIVLCLKFTRYDPSVFSACVERLLDVVEGAPEHWLSDLRAALRGVWAHRFLVGDKDDLAFKIGRVLYRMGSWEQATSFWERSLAEDGPHPATFVNLGLAAEQLGRPDEARRHYERAITAFPNARRPRELLAALDAS